MDIYKPHVINISTTRDRSQFCGTAQRTDLRLSTWTHLEEVLRDVGFPVYS